MPASGTGLSAGMGVLNRGRALVIDRVENAEVVRDRVQVADRLPGQSRRTDGKSTEMGQLFSKANLRNLYRPSLKKDYWPERRLTEWPLNPNLIANTNASPVCPPSDGAIHSG
jgi:hypothetical protein